MSSHRTKLYLKNWELKKLRYGDHGNKQKNDILEGWKHLLLVLFKYYLLGRTLWKQLRSSLSSNLESVLLAEVEQVLNLKDGGSEFDQSSFYSSTITLSNDIIGLTKHVWGKMLLRTLVLTYKKSLFFFLISFIGHLYNISCIYTKLNPDLVERTRQNQRKFSWDEKKKELKQLAYDPFTQFTGGCAPGKKKRKARHWSH